MTDESKHYYTPDELRAIGAELAECECAEQALKAQLRDQNKVTREAIRDMRARINDLAERHQRGWEEVDPQMRLDVVAEDLPEVVCGGCGKHVALRNGAMVQHDALGQESRCKANDWREDR